MIDLINTYGLETIVVGIIITITIAISLFSFKNVTKKILNEIYQQRKEKEKNDELILRHEQDIKQIKDDIAKNNNAMVAVLRSEIIREFRKIRDLDYVPSLDYENLKEMFENYFSLKGNHLVSELYEEFKRKKVDISSTK